MRIFKVLATLPLWVALVAASPTATPSPTDTATRSAAPTPPPSPSPPPSPPPSPTPIPSPTPTPVFATIGLDPAAGGPTVGITVTGQLFLPKETVTLYWDDPRPVAG